MIKRSLSTTLPISSPDRIQDPATRDMLSQLKQAVEELSTRISVADQPEPQYCISFVSRLAPVSGGRLMQYCKRLIVQGGSITGITPDIPLGTLNLGGSLGGGGGITTTNNLTHNVTTITGALWTFGTTTP